MSTIIYGLSVLTEKFVGPAVDSDHLLLQICDTSQNPGTVVSRTNAMTIQLRTDARRNKAGFLILIQTG